MGGTRAPAAEPVHSIRLFSLSSSLPTALAVLICSLFTIHYSLFTIQLRKEVGRYKNERVLQVLRVSVRSEKRAQNRQILESRHAHIRFGRRILSKTGDHDRLAISADKGRPGLFFVDDRIAGNLVREVHLVVCYEYLEFEIVVGDDMRCYLRVSRRHLRTGPPCLPGRWSKHRGPFGRSRYMPFGCRASIPTGWRGFSASFSTEGP